MAGDLPRKGLGQPSSQAFMYGAMAQNLTVTTQDSRVQFEGNWTVQESGYYISLLLRLGHLHLSHFLVSSPFSSLSHSFIRQCIAGTAIYWHATQNPRCGIANVIAVDVSSGTETTTDPIPAILFAKSGLSSGKNHIIDITFVAVGELNGPYLEFYNFT